MVKCLNWWCQGIRRGLFGPSCIYVYIHIYICTFIMPFLLFVMPHGSVTSFWFWSTLTQLATVYSPETSLEFRPSRCCVSTRRLLFISRRNELASFSFSFSFFIMWRRLTVDRGNILFRRGSGVFSSNGCNAEVTST